MRPCLRCLLDIQTANGKVELVVRRKTDVWRYKIWGFISAKERARATDLNEAPEEDQAEEEKEARSILV